MLFIVLGTTLFLFFCLLCLGSYIDRREQKMIEQAQARDYWPTADLSPEDRVWIEAQLEIAGIEKSSSSKSVWGYPPPGMRTDPIRVKPTPRLSGSGYTYTPRPQHEIDKAAKHLRLLNANMQTPDLMDWRGKKTAVPR